MIVESVELHQEAEAPSFVGVAQPFVKQVKRAMGYKIETKNATAFD